MAELVDALGSGPSGGNTVEVRVLFWAPESPCSCGSSQIWCTFGILQKATCLHFTVTFTIISRELYSADLWRNPSSLREHCKVINNIDRLVVSLRLFD